MSLNMLMYYNIKHKTQETQGIVVKKSELKQKKEKIQK